jgi:hypothetical protein
MPEESFASCLYRLSRANAPKIHSFTSINLPGFQIWNRDIDSISDNYILGVLALGTGISDNDLRALTLQALEGVAYEKVRTNGFTQSVLPLGLYHRIRRAFGSQYCPLCLDSDRPFARLSWRLAWNTSCKVHGFILRDRCHACYQPYIFHRKGFVTCWNCEVDVRKAKPAKVSQEAAAIELDMHMALNGDWALCDRISAKHTLVAFNVVNDLMCMIAFGKRSEAFRSALLPPIKGREAHVLQPFRGGAGIERLNVEDRHLVMRYVAIASKDWPIHFVKAACEANYWRSWILRDRILAEVPFPLASLFGTQIFPDHAAITGTKNMKPRRLD